MLQNTLQHSMIGALCSAAHDAGKLADVAAYVKVDQDTLGDLLKQFGSELLIMLLMHLHG